MGRWGAHRFPPRRLTALSDTQVRWLKPLWFLALALALVADVAGTIWVLREAYDFQNPFARLALSSNIEDGGRVSIDPMPGGTLQSSIAPASRILAVDGVPLDRDAKIWTVAERLAASGDKPVTLAIRAPDGRTARHRITPDDRLLQEPSSVTVPRDARVAIRLTVSLLTCLTLIACAAMLFARRPQDPVAMLFSFSFLFFAAVIDPPLRLWLGTGLGTILDLIATLGWVCLVIGLAVFPDGRFTPGFVRWILVLAPVVTVSLGYLPVSDWVGLVVFFVLPLLLVACQAIKYRRFPDGIERQQVKWAAFGFVGGFILLTAAYAVTLSVAETDPNVLIWGMLVVVLFNGGFLLMALGLLISLTRFRLWEADQVISRSAVAAAVTLAVGILWTLSMDLVKTGVEWSLGEENATVAIAASAVLAAGIFAPTQTLALRWAKRRFDHENDRIRKLIARLAVWRTAETPEEIGMRSLSALAAAVHCSSAAILIDTPHGRSVVASRDLDDADDLAGAGHDAAGDERFVEALPLEDEDGPIGQLLLGPRSDLNRYNSGQLAAMRQVTEPLAEALRAAVKRVQQADSVHRLIGSVEERLNRLEQGGGGLSPA